MSIDEARRVAADMLRQAGDETGARVLERADIVVSQLRVEAGATYNLAPTRSLFDLLAYLDPAWAEAEVERAWGEAVEMRKEWKRGAPALAWFSSSRLREYLDPALPRGAP